MSDPNALQRHLPDGMEATGEYAYLSIDQLYVADEASRQGMIDKAAEHVRRRLAGRFHMVVMVPEEASDLLPDLPPNIGLVVLGIQAKGDL